MRKVHAQRCIYTLLQNVVCAADFDVVAFNWTGERRESFQDFEMNEQYRDFEGLLEWLRENEVDRMLYKA